MARRNLGALLLGYFTDDGKLIYAGRAGTGMPVKVLADPQRRLDPLARKTSPLSVPPSRKTRFGSVLVLSRMHWVEPKLVAEITYLTWTADNLLAAHGLRWRTRGQAGQAGAARGCERLIRRDAGLVGQSTVAKLRRRSFKRERIRLDRHQRSGVDLRGHCKPTWGLS